MKSILDIGRNCWRSERADRLAFLIDGKSYYRAFRSALQQARERVYLLAWDLHSEVQLERDEARDDGFPHELGAFINAVLDASEGLEIHVLVWDFSMIYAAEREWRAFSRWLRDPHPRLHFWRDDRLPLGASHHQKVVVIDDALAFAGGLDIAPWRWDDPRHLVDDPRRTDPQGESYEPHHDVQLALTGNAARALGDLCASRWERASGEALPRVRARPDQAPWPEGVRVDAENIDVGIARTYAPFEPYDGVDEIEKLHIDIIDAAQDYIFLENQYLSSRRLVDALAKRLRERDGPEIVLLLTEDTRGWLEEGTMGLHRDRLLEVLHEADEHDRLRVRYPMVRGPGDESAQVYIHAKVIIADDRMIKVGSSNLSNRSMRIDSEVDLVIDAGASPDLPREFLHRLLAVHLGVETGEIASRLGAAGSLVGLIDAGPIKTSHSLERLDFGCSSAIERRIADAELFDPPVPVDPDYWIKSLIRREKRPNVLRRVSIISAVVLAGLAIALLGKWGWSSVVDRDALSGLLASISSSPWAAVVLLGLIFGAGLTGIPINVILVAGAVVLGPWVAFTSSLVGAQLSALAGFGLGRLFGRPLVERVAPEGVSDLSRKLAERGVLSVALIRIIPVAPFVVVNLVAGASHLRFRSFNLGSVLGMAPGMLGVVLLTSGVESVLRDPGWATAAWLATVLALVGGAFFLIRRTLGSRRKRSASGGETDG